jgi:molybdopterin synthase sulfur carrier subunit
VPLVMIPALLRDLTGGVSSVQVAGGTVREVIANLDALYPGVQTRLVEDGRLRPALAVIVDGEIRPQRLRQRLEEHSEVHFLPALSGG